MDLVLENEFLIVRLTRNGAEITSIKRKKDHIEYIWIEDVEV